MYAKLINTILVGAIVQTIFNHYYEQRVFVNGLACTNTTIRANGGRLLNHLCDKYDKLSNYGSLQNIVTTTVYLGYENIWFLITV